MPQCICPRLSCEVHGAGGPSVDPEASARLARFMVRPATGQQPRICADCYARTVTGTGCAGDTMGGPCRCECHPAGGEQRVESSCGPCCDRYPHGMREALGCPCSCHLAGEPCPRCNRREPRLDYCAGCDRELCPLCHRDHKEECAE